MILSIEKHTLYLIPNTFKEWAENFKSLPQYCPVMSPKGVDAGAVEHGNLIVPVLR